MSNLDKLDKSYNRIRKALAKLVELKQTKYEKPKEYMAQKELAWAEAKAALEECSEVVESL